MVEKAIDPTVEEAFHTHIDDLVKPLLDAINGMKAVVRGQVEVGKTETGGAAIERVVAEFLDALDHPNCVECDDIRSKWAPGR